MHAAVGKLDSCTAANHIQMQKLDPSKDGEDHALPGVKDERCGVPWRHVNEVTVPRHDGSTIGRLND